MVSSWMANGAMMPRSFRTFTRSGSTPRASKVVVMGRSAFVIVDRLCPRARLSGERPEDDHDEEDPRERRGRGVSLDPPMLPGGHLRTRHRVAGRLSPARPPVRP